MSDEDIVRRFHQVVGIGKVYGPYAQGGVGTKPTWLWQAHTFETVQAIVAMLWPWLGPRRRAQAKSALGRSR